MLHYQIKGQGKPLVLLHAFPLSSKMWESELQHFSSQYQVIAPDFPGFGKSPLQENISVAGMAKETAQLLDHLKIQGPVYMAGLSMGGYAAFEFLRQFPGRIKALGFFATRSAADTPEGKEKRMQSIEALKKFGIEPFTRKIVKSQLGKTTQESNPALVERALSIMKEADAAAAIAALKAMAERRDSTDLLASISFPVLVAGGEEDEIVPIKEMQSMHEKIRGSEFHALPKAAHLINLEQPQAFRKILEEFLKKI